MSGEGSIRSTSERVPAGTIVLEAVRGIPDGAEGMVLFAHGSGSGRHSPRNSYVAHALQRAGVATLLLDLLTEREAADRANVFDVDLLAERLASARAWLRQERATRDLRVGYFGASTGAAAALAASAGDPGIAAIVARGGRCDLAGGALAKVRAPTLLIVGGNDTAVVRLNEEAFAQLRCDKQLCIVPGAGHLFEEPGALDDVVRLALGWYGRHLTAAPRSA